MTNDQKTLSFLIKRDTAVVITEYFIQQHSAKVEKEKGGNISYMYIYVTSYILSICIYGMYSKVVKCMLLILRIVNVMLMSWKKHNYWNIYVT